MLFIQKWKDNGLKWNKSEYGGLDEIRLPVQRIWTPGIAFKKIFISFD